MFALTKSFIGVTKHIAQSRAVLPTLQHVFNASHKRTIYTPEIIQPQFHMSRSALLDGNLWEFDKCTSMKGYQSYMMPRLYDEFVEIINTHDEMSLIIDNVNYYSMPKQTTYASFMLCKYAIDQGSLKMFRVSCKYINYDDMQRINAYLINCLNKNQTSLIHLKNRMIFMKVKKS